MENSGKVPVYSFCRVAYDAFRSHSLLKKQHRIKRNLSPIVPTHQSQRSMTVSLSKNSQKHFFMIDHLTQVVFIFFDRCRGLNRRGLIRPSHLWRHCLYEQLTLRNHVPYGGSL